MAEYRIRVIVNGGEIMIDGTGTRRRVQAMVSLGWSLGEIGARIGMRHYSVSDLLEKPGLRRVYPPTAEKVRAVYDEIGMLPAPDDWLHQRNARMAKGRGFPGPLAWDDEMIDDPHAIPVGMSHSQLYPWFWQTASLTERIEYVLEYGLDVTRRWPSDKFRASGRH